MDVNKNIHFRGVDEEYSQFVSDDFPQCISITSGITEDSTFNKKIGDWKGEIKKLRGIDPDQILFHGNLTQLLQVDQYHVKPAPLIKSHLTISHLTKRQN